MRIEIKTDTPIKDICEEHGCSRATASRARKRGYLIKDYHSSGEHASPKDHIEFLRILELPEIYKKPFSIKEWKIQKVLNGTAKLYKKEFITFKSEVVRLRNLLRVFIQKPTNENLIHVVASPYIVKIKICRYATFRKCPTFVDDELQEVKIKVAALYNALNF